MKRIQSMLWLLYWILDPASTNNTYVALDYSEYREIKTSSNNFAKILDDISNIY